VPGAIFDAQRIGFMEVLQMYERRGGSVFGAFLLGGIVGAVLGLLFAPRSGAETREMLTERANDYWGQANEMYSTGVNKVGDAMETGRSSATERSEQLRGKIDEARARLQDQVARSAETAKGKIAETAPVVKDVVDKAAEGTKSGVDFATGKAHEGLDFVSRSLSGGAEQAEAEAPEAAAETGEEPEAAKTSNSNEA
jgi:gas vesicle protein